MNNEKKSNNSFLLLLFHVGKLTFCQKLYLEKRSLYCYICFTVFFTQQVIENAVTPTAIQMFIGYVDAILRSKILDNRLGFLTQILIATDYFLYLYISDIQLPSIQGKKCILIWEVNFIIKSIRKRTETLAKRLFSFSIIVFNMKFLVILFMRKSICQGKLFGSLHTSNRIYLLRIVFQTMYTSKIST